MKEIKIIIDKKFIEESVYQENWGEVKLDQSELTKNISKYIKDSCETIVRKVVEDVVVDICKKELRKQVVEKVKSFINGMAGTDLYYRERYRDLLVEIARENKKQINEKVKAFIDDGEMYKRISDSIGYEMANKFVEAMRNGKID